MKKYTFEDLKMRAVTAKSNKEYNCSINLTVEGETWQAYTCSVADRDLLFYTDKGTVSYAVDSYGDRHVAEMIDWNRE